MIYAITDIETTGSFASAHSITEIAICLHDGEKVIREYQSLVNPGVRLPPFITSLTGITDRMLANAPEFDDIADEVFEMLSDAVFVAHNVNFDYSFIRAELEASGFSWNPKKLCTVRLARRAFPGLRSYGLANLCRELGVINSSAHRAMGDTLATVEIFERILEKLPHEDLHGFVARGSKESFLPNHLDEKEYERLPEKPGVYYFLDQSGKPIYIGKANNIRKRVRTHFSPATESERHQSFLREIHHIDFVPTGNELIALILEDAEIRRHWPRHNRAQKRPPGKVGIFMYEDRRGILRLTLNKAYGSVSPVKMFTSRAAACKWLVRFADEHQLDYSLVGLPVNNEITEVDATTHNQKLRDALTITERSEACCVLLAEGRSNDEHGFVLVNEGRPEGYGFIPRDVAIARYDALENYLKRVPLTETNTSIIRSYLENPRGLRRLDIPREGQ